MYSQLQLKPIRHIQSSARDTQNSFAAVYSPLRREILENETNLAIKRTLVFYFTTPDLTFYKRYTDIISLSILSAIEVVIDDVCLCFFAFYNLNSC